MNFTLEKLTSQGVRIGALTAKDGITMATPLCLPHTRGGFTPFLTPDIVSDIPYRPPAAMLTTSTLFLKPGPSILKKFGQGIHRFLSLNGTLLYMSVQDPSAFPDPSYNNTASVSIWAPSGRIKVTPEEYMSFIEAFQPDVFESLCDTVSSVGHANKRIRKSVDRTLQFLDMSLQKREENEKLKHIWILGAIEGSDVMEERIRSAKETAIRPVDGFVIEGFELEYNKDSMSDIIRTVNDLLPAEKIRFINGLYLPSDIFKALERGVDVFDSSYAMKATEKGCALSYPIKLQESNTNKFPDKAEPCAAEPCATEPVRIFEIDLKDPKYKMSMEPLVSDCTCYTCTNYSCAYVHHLLDTKELLANILLMVHNLQHIMTFFENIRRSITNGKYEEYKSSCCNFLNID